MISSRMESLRPYWRDLRLFRRIIMAWLLNRFHRGLGTCLHCSRNWAICKGHITHFTEDRGVFPLCEDCWKDLSITERLFYYYALWWLQEADEKQWHLVERAVKEGK